MRARKWRRHLQAQQHRRGLSHPASLHPLTSLPFVSSGSQQLGLLRLLKSVEATSARPCGGTFCMPPSPSLLLLVGALRRCWFSQKLLEL